MRNFVSGFGDLVLLELVTPGFLSFMLLGNRFPFVALQETRAIFNLPLTFANAFGNNLKKSLDESHVHLSKLRLRAKRR